MICVTGFLSFLCSVIAWPWNCRKLPNGYLILMRVLWVVIRSSLAMWSVNSAVFSEQGLSLCADPSKLTRRFIKLFSKGPHSWAYSQGGELVFQWISLSIWIQSSWNMAPAKERPRVMNSLCSVSSRIKSCRKEDIGCKSWDAEDAISGIEKVVRQRSSNFGSTNVNLPKMCWSKKRSQSFYKSTFLSF